MSETTKAVLSLIDQYPEDGLPLYRALWAGLSKQQRQIIQVIANEVSINVGDLTKIVGVTQQTVSAQLFKLRKLGLLKDTKFKREVFYSIAKERSLLGVVAKE
jgi:DNA-binding transcriptional ArsR family regulator